jgi:SPP1 gp7 family putative phage head morphogenesis protein
VLSDLAQRQLTSYQEGRLQALLTNIRGTMFTGVRNIRKDLHSSWLDLVDIESKFTLNAINKPIGIELASTALSPAQMRSVIGDAMVQGSPQAEWWDRQAQTMVNRLSDQIRLGMISGQTTPEIVSRIAGAFELTRPNIEAIVSTSLASVSTEARLATYLANDDVISAVQQRSVLDTRTTPICQAYSGLVWSLPDFKPVGHDLPWNGGPPRHWRCRSTTIPVVKAFQDLGKLKTGGRSSEADAYFQKRLEDQGLSESEVKSSIRHAQASMDGQVADDLKYEDWLKGKSEAVQKDVLGPTKFNLWNQGKLSFTDLVNEDGRPYTVQELKDAAGIEDVPKAKVFKDFSPEPLPEGTKDQMKAHQRDVEAARAVNAWGDANFKTWADSLTADETAGLHEYQGAGYRHINKALREFAGDVGQIADEDTLDHVEAITAALEKAKVPENVMAFRSADAKAFDKNGKAQWESIFTRQPTAEERAFITSQPLDPKVGPFELMDRIRRKNAADWILEKVGGVGAIIQDDGFMSTALVEKRVMSDPIVFRISVPEGTPGAYIQTATGWDRHETELLLQRGTKLRIDAVTEPGPGDPITARMIVHASVIS